MLSWPSTVKAPSSVANPPTLMVSCACAAPIPAASAAAAVATRPVGLVTRIIEDSSLFGWRSAVVLREPSRAPVLPPAAGRAGRPGPADESLPEPQQPIGRKEDDCQEHKSDQRVEPFPVDQID